ncbi:hypothetical protein E2P81_ATG04097 [Venturia nashicola]|nr:hypothetical protein E2P81_ATG04097 [Venturia nashicola]
MRGESEVDFCDGLDCSLWMGFSLSDEEVDGDGWTFPGHRRKMKGPVKAIYWIVGRSFHAAVDFGVLMDSDVVWSTWNDLLQHWLYVGSTSRCRCHRVSLTITITITCASDYSIANESCRAT